MDASNDEGNKVNQYIIPNGLGTKAVSKKEFDAYGKSLKAAADFLLGPKKTKAKGKKLSKKPAVEGIVVKKAPKAGSKQARVNELVKAVLTNNDRKLDKAFKQEIIGEIMTLCEMSHAGATTYFYNAMKAL